MAIQFKGIDEVIKAGFQESKARLPADIQIPDKDKPPQIDSYDSLVTSLKTEGKLDDDLAHTIASSTLWGFLDKFGIDPNEWQFTISAVERGKVRYGPDEFEEARKFFGTWSAVGSTALTMGTIASWFLGIGGTLIAAQTLRLAATAIRTGKGLKAVSQIIQLGALRGIKILGIPAVIREMAQGVAWFASTQITATGDLGTYLKQGIARAEEIVAAEERKEAARGAGTGMEFIQTPKTRITMTKQSKPALFLGTLFSQRISSQGAFDRVLDDQITSKEELESDAQQNLNRWLASLPARLFYTINVSLNPFDENGIKQTGYWATLSIFARRIAGTTLPIDTILLGPVDPIIYYPKPTETQQIQIELPKKLTAEEIANVEFPAGNFAVVDKSGSVTPVVFRESTEPAQKAAAPVVVPTTPAAVQAPATAPAVEVQPTPSRGSIPSAAAPVSPPFAEPSVGFVIPGATLPSAPKIFRIGTRITVAGLTGNSTLRVRQTPALTGAILYGQANDAIGTLISNPIAADGEVWWNVSYDRNDKGVTISGWSAERFLRLL